MILTDILATAFSPSNNVYGIYFHSNNLPETNLQRKYQRRMLIPVFTFESPGLLRKHYPAFSCIILTLHPVSYHANSIIIQIIISRLFKKFIIFYFPHTLCNSFS
jgi:hypothetical protein